MHDAKLCLVTPLTAELFIHVFPSGEPVKVFSIISLLIKEGLGEV